MSRKPSAERPPKLTDAERHERFKEMAKEVGASEEPADFDRAFSRIAKPAAK